MSKFVNYQKRGIELPPGCKDLIDLLPREARDTAEGLAHIDRYVSRLFQSRTGRRSVWITSFSFPVTLGLIHGKGILRALIFLTTEREESVRAILRNAEIIPSQDDAVGGNGPFARFLLCPVRADAVGAGRLVSELLRNGCALPEDASLDFRFCEKD